MPLIKRYPNRKLYDTETKQYITLDGIAELIRQGQEVTVIDNATGDDLTTITLTQIIFEQEKKQNSVLPHTVLAGLIRSSGDRLNSLQRILNSPRQFWGQVDEEIHRRVDMLVTQGELSQNEGQTLLEKLLSPAFNLREEIKAKEYVTIPSEVVEKYVAEHNIPTQTDFQRLLDQLDTLAHKIDEAS